MTLIRYMQKQESIKLRILNCRHDDKTLDYDAIKKEALANSPMVASYPLSVFELGRNKTIKMNGQIIPVNNRAYFAFLKRVLKVDPKFVSRFKKVTDEKTEIAMLSVLKSGMAQHKDLKVHVLANPHEKEITNFSAGKHSFRTNSELLTIFENVMNKYPSLEVRDFHMTTDGTLNIASRSNEEVFGKLQNEVFRGGLTFRNSYSEGSLISHNAFRLVCLNGMFGFNDLPLHVGSDEKALIDFFTKLDSLNENNWMEGNFWDKMENAMHTNASVSELIQAKNTMLNNSFLEEEDLRLYLPEFHDTRKFLHSKNVIMDTLETAKLKNCPTNVKMWDLINRVTDFGSHDYGYEQDFDAIQKAGGRLLSKPFDTNNLVIFS